MIQEQDIEKAVHWLIANAEAAAKARAEREYMSEFRKSLKAQIMSEHAGDPLGVQEREAYSDPRYQQHLEAMREAVRADELMRWRRTAAETKISVWQSQQRALRP